MSLISRLAQRNLNGISVSDPAINDLLRDSILLEPTFTGNTVTVEKSLRLVPVFSAVSLLSSAVGSLPLRVYKTLPDGGKQLAPQHRASKFLTVQPNPMASADEVFESVTASLLLWGNAFLMKEKDDQGNLVALWPIAPSRMRIGRRPEDGMPEYYIDGRGNPDGGGYTSETFIHFRGLSFDGLVGLSPIQNARQTLGLHQAMEEYAGRFWNNSARPSGLIKHPNRLTAEGAERLRSQWNSSHQGLANSSRVAVLEEGAEFVPMSLPASDAQLAEQLGQSDIRIAQLFRIPPRLLMADIKDSFTYSSAEWEAIDFVKWSLRRWLVRIENALLRDPDVFKSNGLGASYFCRFDTSELTRGDRAAQANTDVSLLNAGVLSVDEVRQNLDLNPVGDAFVEPPTPTQPPAQA